MPPSRSSGRSGTVRPIGSSVPPFCPMRRRRPARIAGCDGAYEPRDPDLPQGGDHRSGGRRNSRTGIAKLTEAETGEGSSNWGRPTWAAEWLRLSTPTRPRWHESRNTLSWNRALYIVRQATHGRQPCRCCRPSRWRGRSDVPEWQPTGTGCGQHAHDGARRVFARHGGIWRRDRSVEINEGCRWCRRTKLSSSPTARDAAPTRWHSMRWSTSSAVWPKKRRTASTRKNTLSAALRFAPSAATASVAWYLSPEIDSPSLIQATSSFSITLAICWKIWGPWLCWDKGRIHSQSSGTRAEGDRRRLQRSRHLCFGRAPSRASANTNAFWGLMHRRSVPDEQALELIGFSGEIGKSGKRPRFRLSTSQVTTLNGCWRSIARSGHSRQRRCLAASPCTIGADERAHVDRGDDRGRWGDHHGGLAAAESRGHAQGA